MDLEARKTFYQICIYIISLITKITTIQIYRLVPLTLLAFISIFILKPLYVMSHRELN